jgi:hypothetical protein
MNAVRNKAMPTRSMKMQFTRARLSGQECEKYAIVINPATWTTL